jgi:ribosome-associated protein
MCNILGLSEEEKELLKVNLSSRLTTDLFLNCDEDRSQFRNKDIVTKRFWKSSKGLRCRKLESNKIPKSAIRKGLKQEKRVIN